MTTSDSDFPITQVANTFALQGMDWKLGTFISNAIVTLRLPLGNRHHGFEHTHGQSLVFHESLS